MSIIDNFISLMCKKDIDDIVNMMGNYRKKQCIDVNKIVNFMYDYQRKEDINGQCLTNTQYLYHSVTASFPWMQKVKAIAVIAHRKIYTECGIVDGKMQVELAHMCNTHVVLQINETQLIDPSAEVNDQDMTYITYNIPAFLKRLKEAGMAETELKQILSRYLKFKSYADRINSGETIIVDEAFYNAQADYVEQKVNELRNQ